MITFLHITDSIVNVQKYVEILEFTYNINFQNGLFVIETHLQFFMGLIVYYYTVVPDLPRKKIPQKIQNHNDQQ